MLKGDSNTGVFLWNFQFLRTSFTPVDTGRKLKVHKTFRRCPGRLLNVSCTFNLRPVSAGMKTTASAPNLVRYNVAFVNWSTVFTEGKLPLQLNISTETRAKKFTNSLICIDLTYRNLFIKYCEILIPVAIGKCPVFTENIFLWISDVLLPPSNSANIYLFNANNGNSRKRCEICSKLTMKRPEQNNWRGSGVFIVNFMHISHLFLKFLLLTLNKLRKCNWNKYSSVRKMVNAVLRKLCFFYAKRCLYSNTRRKTSKIFRYSFIAMDVENNRLYKGI